MTRVLVIDDDEAIAGFIKMGLEALGVYQVTKVFSGQAGIEAARSFDPDIIFLDVMLPDMEGSEVAAQVRKVPQSQKTPIVFLTGILTPEEAQKSQGVIGGEVFLAKPVIREQLVDHINRYARRR